MRPPGLMAEYPELKTDFYPPNWCLSLAVAFWGLRRVKYAWIQHGWLNLFKKNNNKKTQQQTNDMKSLFGRDKQNSESIFPFRELCRSPRSLLDLLFSSEAEIQSHLPRTHSRLMHNPSHVCIYIHICSHLSTGWRGDKPLDRHRDPSFKFIH